MIFASLILCAPAAGSGSVLDPGSGYRYTFPVSPTLETVRRMMLAGCVIVSYPRTWVCPDAPPYTYA